MARIDEIPLDHALAHAASAAAGVLEKRLALAYREELAVHEWIAAAAARGELAATTPETQAVLLSLQRRHP